MDQLTKRTRRSRRKSLISLVSDGNHNLQTFSYDAMQCWFHTASEAPDSCLLGGKHTTCGPYRCFVTVGKSCSSGNEAKLIGNECGKSLVCGKLIQNYLSL